MNIGIVGLGYWGTNIVRNVVMNEHIKEVYCTDLDKDNCSKIKKQFDSIHLVDSFEELLSDSNVDAVIIVTPVSTHFKLGLQALQAGKHILLEKPFTETVKEGEELLRVAASKGLTVMVDHTFLYTSSVRKIKSLYQSGEIGDLYYYDSVRVNLGLFQKDVNVIWDLAPHDFSIMDYILDKEPISLTANGSDHIGKGMEDIAYVHIKFANNLCAHFHLNWLSPVKIRKVLVAGTKKMVVYDDNEVAEKIKIYDKGIDVKTAEETFQTLVNYRRGDIYSPVLQPTEALKLVIQEFVDSINEKREPFTSGKDGVKVVKLLEATQKSIANNGATVMLS